MGQLGNVRIEDKLDGTLGLAEYNLQRTKADGDFSSIEYKKDRCPGDLGFDPLGLSKGKGADLVTLHNTEVNAGRLAMIGLTTFLFKEFVVKDAGIAAKIL